MAEKIKPCHCGYEGELMGIVHAGFLSLTCPSCNRTVEAFTTEGLAQAWNKPAPTPPVSEQQHDGRMPSDSRNRMWELIDAALTDTVPDGPKRGDICNILAPLLASEQQRAVAMPASVLIQALENTRDIIDMQLDLVAARAKGSYLDKTPVMRSLRAHRARCNEALTVYNRELLRLNPHLQPAAPSQRGE